MKILFDENLSPVLATRLADLYPDSAHVHDAGLGQGDDQQIWSYAKANGYVIASKDSDLLNGACAQKLLPRFFGYGSGTAPQTQWKCSFAHDRWK